MESGLAGPAADPRKVAPPAPPEEASDAQLLGRFVSARDEDAFAELVRRHGPMVLGVCRRVLRDPEAAQDAFQVSFLVLARKAGEVERPALLGNWLYGVACRTAMRVRDRAARRQRHERQGPAMPEPEQRPPADTEALAVLDEELNALAEMDRALIVLCCLEGHTHEEAARRLACPVGSVAWRMARARELLHRRLTRRGVALSASLFALFLSAQRAGAGVPDALAEETTRAAAGFAEGTPGAVPADHAALTEEVLGGINAGSRRSVLRALAILALLLLGVAVAAATAAGRSGGHTAPAPAASVPPSGAAHPVPDGGPAGAGGCGGSAAPQGP